LRSRISLLIAHRVRQPSVRTSFGEPVLASV
jgi:hypothetical protein